DVPVRFPADGVVPQLSPAPGEVCEAARRRLHHGLPARRQPGRNRPPAREGIQDSGGVGLNQLFDLSSMSDLRKQLDLAAGGARLEGARGGDYWRSLNDLADTPEFQDLLEREFPRQAIGWSDDEDPVNGRRNFLKLMGASLALGGLAACTRQP